MSEPVEIVLIVSNPPCPRCNRTRQLLTMLAEKLGAGVVVRELDILDTAADRYGVVATPSVIVGTLIVSMGRVPREEGLEALLRNQLASR